MTKKYDNVAVLMGGGSSEREISLKTGRAVTQGLREAGYNAAEVVADRGDVFTLPYGTEAVFIALHGTFGEDGGAQAALEKAGVPYTGSRAESARISFDKILSREAFAKVGIPIAGEWRPGDKNVRFPVVVKPARQGSSVGITIAKNEAEYSKGLEEAAKFGGGILVEEFIRGREWTVPILGRRVLPIVEVSPKIDGGWYSYDAKHNSGGTTGYSYPEDDPANAAVAAQVRRLALAVFDAVGARSVARVDFMIAEDGSPFVLELNSIPGCSEASILPKAAAKAGIAFADLCAAVMEEAV